MIFSIAKIIHLGILRIIIKIKTASIFCFSVVNKCLLLDLYQEIYKLFCNEIQSCRISELEPNSLATEETQKFG